MKQYEAEEIDGTSLDIKESFNFVQPSCPNIDEDGKFEGFTCFDYLEDTVRTKQETSTTTTRASTDAAIPPMHIAIFSGQENSVYQMSLLFHYLLPKAWM